MARRVWPQAENKISRTRRAAGPANASAIFPMNRAAKYKTGKATTTMTTPKSKPQVSSRIVSLAHHQRN
jgi:hypothetical protein